MTDKTVKCRTCGGGHWTLQCPYKDTGYIPTKTATPAIPEEKKPVSTQPEDKGLLQYFFVVLLISLTKRYCGRLKILSKVP